MPQFYSLLMYFPSFYELNFVVCAPKQTGAEICLAAYEALAPVVRVLVSVLSPHTLACIRENDNPLLPDVEGKPVLDSFVCSFLQNINNLLAVGLLVRTRRAVLMNWKVFPSLYYFKVFFLYLVFVSFLSLLFSCGLVDIVSMDYIGEVVC